MDPKQIYELIVAGGQNRSKEIDNDFDVSEMLCELSAVEKAVKELGNVVGDYERQNDFNNDYAVINRKLYEKKIALEFESVDAAYEI
jgi:hypothetical protein